MDSTNKAKVPDKVMFQPDDREKQIIQQEYRKHGLKKAQQVISMALTRMAEQDGILVNS